jgi:hypothetical protein
MVNFSSLHDEGGPVDVFYHHRRDKLLIPRLTVVISLILAFHNIGTFLAWLIGGKLLGSLSFTPLCRQSPNEPNIIITAARRIDTALSSPITNPSIILLNLYITNEEEER